MIKSSLSVATPSVAPYIGNESIIVNKAIRYGHITYTWDTRFISFIDAFFLGTSVEATTKNTVVPLDKFIAYANGTLPTTDLSYDMIYQYNDYLATLRLGE